MLLECQVKTAQELCTALYALGVALDYCKAAGRFVPELYGMLVRCARCVYGLAIEMTGSLLGEGREAMALKEKGRPDERIPVGVLCSEEPDVTLPQLQMAVWVAAWRGKA